MKSKQVQTLLWLAIGALGCALFVLDMYLPLGVGNDVLYAILVFMSMLLVWQHATLLVAVSCTALTAMGGFFSPSLTGLPLWVGVSDRLFGFLIIWIPVLFIAQRRQAEQGLQRAYDELDLRVQERTRELADVNQALVTEITERMTTERSLRDSESALEASQLALQRSQEDLQALAAQLMAVQEGERRRISRDLHDDVNQRLALLSMDLRGIEQASASLPAWLRHGIRSVLDRTIALSDDIRRLAYRFHPSILDDLGLETALQHLIDDFSNRTGIKTVFVRQELTERPPEEIAACLYRIVQESLNNVVKHAHASRVEIELIEDEDTLELTFRDTGVGFEPDQVAHSRRGVGLVNMKERVRLVQGTLEIHSTPGQGTFVHVRVPVPVKKS